MRWWQKIFALREIAANTYETDPIRSGLPRLYGGQVGAQSLPANGSITVTPITNSVYTLTAYGPGGQTVSVSISVFVR